MSGETGGKYEERPPYKNKTDYFASLAIHLFSKFKQDIGFGKLTRRDSDNKKLPADDRGNWINVTEHCLVEAAAIEELGKALDLDRAEIDKLVAAAAVHDWDKRLERRPEQFTPAEIEAAKQAYDKLNISEELLGAVKAEFVEQVITQPDQPVAWLQKVMHYVDVITDESDIIPYEVRLDKAVARAPHLKDDPTWEQKFRPFLGAGKNHFDACKEIAGREQQEIFEHLVAQGHKLSSPNDVPAFIKARIERNYK